MNATTSLYVATSRCGAYIYVKWLGADNDSFQAVLASFQMRFPAGRFDRRHRAWQLPSSQADALAGWAAPRFDEQYWQDGRCRGPSGREATA